MTNAAERPEPVPAEPALVEEVEQRLEGRIGELLAEVREQLAVDWPDYAAFLDQDLANIEEGSARILRALIASATGSETNLIDDGRAAPLFEQIGRLQWEGGHDLTRLLTAYQVGARVAWRHVSDAVRSVDLPPEMIAVLAERLFDFISYLSRASTAGYLQAQDADSRARERSREDLADLLLSERASAAAVRAAADRARWQLPREAALVLVNTHDTALSPSDVISRLGSSVLPVRQGTLVGAIVPEPATRRRQLATALSGWPSVVGVGVEIEALARTVELAQLALRMHDEHILRGEPVFVDEHLDTIIVHRDGRLLGYLRAQVLAPLDGLPDGARERLVETLVCWLRHHGDRLAVARELTVHPQTVSYRLTRLRALFGAQLDDPRERSRLLLALAWG
jgi:hypothetical protein